MSDSNGVGDKWVILLAPGARLVGKVEGGEWLNPVYEFQGQIVPGRERGSAGIAHSAAPICFLPSIDKIHMPASAIVIPVDSLSASDRRAVMGAIAEGEKIAEGIRMAQTGIVPAVAGVPKGPLVP